MNKNPTPPTASEGGLNLDFVDDESSELDFRRGIDPNSVYELTSLLGEGSYGAVYKAKSRSQINSEEVAIKIIPDADDDLTSLWREIRFLQVLRSPFVVSFIESLLYDNELWLVMELCDGGSLYDLKEAKHGNFDENQLRAIMAFSTLGLAHLHSQMSIHRDVKSGNILLTKDGKAKLGDFGISAQLTDTIMKRRTVIGSPYWMAPEVIQETSYDSKADIWSLGITLLELCEGNPPHFSVHPMRAIFIISSRPAPTLKDPSMWSEAMNDFVSKCLVKNAEHRSTAADLLKHPWLRSTVKEIGMSGRGHYLLEQLVRENWDEIERVRFSRFKMPDNIPVGVDGNSGNMAKSPENSNTQNSGVDSLQREEIDESMMRTIPRANSFGNPNSLVGIPATRQQLRNASLSRSSTPTAAMRVRSAGKALPNTATLLNEYMQNEGILDFDDSARPKVSKFSVTVDSAGLDSQEKYSGLDLKGDAEELKREYQRNNNKIKRRKSNRNNVMRYSGSHDDSKVSDDDSTVDERSKHRYYSSALGSESQDNQANEFNNGEQYSSLVRSPPTPPNVNDSSSLQRSVIKSKFNPDSYNRDDVEYSPSYASAALNDISGADGQNSLVPIDGKTRAQPKTGRARGMQAALKYFQDEPIPQDIHRPVPINESADMKESKPSSAPVSSGNQVRKDSAEMKPTGPQVSKVRQGNLSTGGITISTAGGNRGKSEVAVLNTLVQLDEDAAQQSQYIKKEIMKQLAVLKKQYRQDLEDLTKAYESRRKVLKEALLIYSSAAELNEVVPSEVNDQLGELSSSPDKGAAMLMKGQGRSSASGNTGNKGPDRGIINTKYGNGGPTGRNIMGTPSTVNDVYAAPAASTSRDDISVSTESTANVNNNQTRNNDGNNYNNKRGKRGKGKSRNGGGPKSPTYNDAKD